jgi:hypothetical protein
MINQLRRHDIDARTFYRWLTNNPKFRHRYEFEILVPEKEDSKVLIYEVYKDRPAFEAHWNGPAMARTRKEGGDMIQAFPGRFARFSDEPTAPLRWPVCRQELR